MNYPTLIGIDLAKSVFQVAVMHNGKVQSNQRLSRSRLGTFIANHPQATIAMEACFSAHYWARTFETYGHQVLLIPPQFVKPFSRGNKTDANDALAIIEAAQRPNLNCVPVKTIYQQDIQNLHRIRKRLVGNRTALINQTRGLLLEFGIVCAVGKKGFLLGLETALNASAVSDLFKTQLHATLDELQWLAERITQIEDALKAYVEQDAYCRIVCSIPGIGYLNASALVCKYGTGAQFNRARSLSVHLGLTPRLCASGHRHQLLGITKRGDPYLRKQLIQGAKALLIVANKRKDDVLCQWAVRVKQRRGHHIAAVALANRLARLAWVLLQKRELYQPRPVLTH